MQRQTQFDYEYLLYVHCIDNLSNEQKSSKIPRKKCEQYFRVCAINVQREVIRLINDLKQITSGHNCLSNARTR